MLASLLYWDFLPSDHSFFFIASQRLLSCVGGLTSEGMCAIYFISGNNALCKQIPYETEDLLKLAMQISTCQN